MTIWGGHSCPLSHRKLAKQKAQVTTRGLELVLDDARHFDDSSLNRGVNRDVEHRNVLSFRTVFLVRNLFSCARLRQIPRAKKLRFGMTSSTQRLLKAKSQELVAGSE
jgi:hypothetical protein